MNPTQRANHAAKMLQQRAPLRAKPKPKLQFATAYECGLADGARNKQRPSVKYSTGPALVAWWEGWKDGRHSEAARALRIVAGTEPSPRMYRQNWEERREQYLSIKSIACEESFSHCTGVAVLSE